MMPALRRDRGTAPRIHGGATHSVSRARGPTVVVRTEFGDYLQAFRLGGASFETSDDARAQQLARAAQCLWRNIASPDVALWTMSFGDRASSESNGCDRGGRQPTAAGRLRRGLHRRYRRRLADETLMHNELYLAVLYRPVAGSGDRSAVARARARRSATRCERSLPMRSMPARSLRKRSLASLGALRAGAARVLSARAASGAPRCSSISLCWSMASTQRMPLPRGRSTSARRTPGCSSAPRPSNTASPHRDPRGRHSRHQGVSDTDRRRHVRPAAVGAVSFVLTQSFAFLAKPRARRCCSGNSTAWPTPATSRCPRPRSSKTRWMH